MLIGVPCKCKGMDEAIGSGSVLVGTVTDGDKYKSTLCVGVVSIRTSELSAFQYCPWCGNAVIEIKEIEASKGNDEGESVMQPD